MYHIRLPDSRRAFLAEAREYALQLVGDDPAEIEKHLDALYDIVDAFTEFARVADDPERAWDEAWEAMREALLERLDEIEREDMHCKEIGATLRLFARTE